MASRFPVGATPVAIASACAMASRFPVGATPVAIASTCATGSRQRRRSDPAVLTRPRESPSIPAPPPRGGHDMELRDLETSALRLNALYEQLEIRKYGRPWTTQELALGFMG